jgi:hypothetical protein
VSDISTSRLRCASRRNRGRPDINTVMSPKQATEGLTALASRTTRGKTRIKITD